MSSVSKRKEMDLMKLLMNDYKVETINDSSTEFFVILNGPPNSPYAGGVWKVRIELPENYPYSSPSVGFANRIYHPNIDEASGTVCLNLLNKDWSPMFDLVNVFEMFLPRLLLQPNPDDPLNADAAALLLSDKETYEVRVKEYCQQYAKPEDVGIVEEKESTDEELSEESKDSGDEATTSGPVDP